MFTTTLKALEYGWLVAAVGFALAAFWVLCQVSRECREIRDELRAEGECIEPLKAVVDRLDVLHAELFGADGE